MSPINAKSPRGLAGADDIQTVGSWVKQLHPIPGTRAAGRPGLTSGVPSREVRLELSFQSAPVLPEHTRIQQTWTPSPRKYEHY